jgi:acetyl-CoA carboxylase carboxyl transferase subunit beta
MSILNWFSQRDAQSQVSKAEKLNIPGDVWHKCPQCSEVLFLKELEANLQVCPKCGYHFRISPEDRIRFLFDANSFVETHISVSAVDFLEFEDTEPYTSRLKKAQKKTGHQDAVVVGSALLEGMPVNIAVMNFGFLGGSMGSVVGEKITRLIEAGIENGNPVIIFTSSGGARMQEGVLSLMQMAKTSGALFRLAEKNVPYISVLCDPTTGGTSASFAMLGDLNFAEPGALVSFAGPRVIEQTIRQKLPKGFQRSEFLLQHGMVDRVVSRLDMRETLALSIRLLDPREGKSAAPSKKAS